MTTDPNAEKRVHEAESMPVQLTRMEGKLDRITDRVDDLRTRVDTHDHEIRILSSQTQSLEEGATANEKTAVALALALKDAKETADAASSSGYAPITKVYAAAAAIAAALVVYQSLPGK